MTVVPKKMIPWQERERIGGSKAFFMTLFEAMIRPVDYFEKLEVREDYQEPLIFNFYNAFYLAGPLIPQMLYVVPFVAVIFILMITPALLYFVTFLFQKLLSLLGETTDFKTTFYVLAFSSPAFVLAYVPGVGYWFAACAFTMLAAIGLTTVYQFNFWKIFVGLILVPLVVLIPFGTVRFAKDWQALHPPVDSQLEAQKVLAALGVAAENYALKHKGLYPTDSVSLVNGPEKYLVEDYCGQMLHNYVIICDFRGFGYYVKAQPEGWKGRGKKSYYMTTGGILREE